MTLTQPTATPATPPARPGGGITRLTAADDAIASSTLAAAFHDDPIFTWIVPDEPARRAHLARWFEVVVRALRAHRASYRTADGMATGLWVPPGTDALTAEENQRLAEATAAFGAAAHERSAVLSAAMDICHPQQPHHYLWFLGVAPSHQGRGLGGRLLAAYLQALDRTGEAAYLEATSDDSRRLYERHGFEVTDVLTATPDSPPLWAMWRDPR